METTYLMSKAIPSPLNRIKKFEDGGTGKGQKIKFSKFQNF